MADTSDNTSLSSTEWTDLYAASGLDVGTALLAENVGGVPVLLYAGATAPDVSSGLSPGYQLLQSIGDQKILPAGSTGAFARTKAAIGTINVSDATGIA